VVGKRKDRENKLDWLSRTVVCPACYRAEQAEKERAAGLVYNLDVTLMHGTGTTVYITEWFSGDTLTHKDAIKAAGYSWAELEDRAFVSFFGTMRYPQKRWQKVHTVDLVKMAKETDDLKAMLRDKILQIGAASDNFDCAKVVLPDAFSPDVAMIGHAIATAQATAAAQAEQDAKIAEIIKPLRPEWARGKKWNGTIYGSAKSGQRIYLDGEEVKMTAEQAAEMKNYLAAFEEYKVAVKKIKNANAEGGS
jgi:hypothetical protein